MSALVDTAPLIGHVVGGQVTTPEGSRTQDVFDPATGQVTGRVLLAEQADVDAAVAAAVVAAESWSQEPVAKRTAVLFALREQIVQHTDELAAIITAEHGKVLADSHGEIARGLEVIEYACGMPQLLKGEYTDQAATGVDVFSFREPLGVVAGITPFNFPAMVPLWMAPMAIATGNAFVLKPSERDPSASLFLARMWKAAGLPDGVFSVVQGDRVAVDALLTHPDIAAVSFVGSTPIAQHVHATATAHGKRVQALGGAKNHAVVLADADLDLAATHLTGAAFGAAGERCMAISVAVVVDDVADALLERLTAAAQKVRVAPGNDPDSDMGPVITRASQLRIEEIVTDAVDSGASAPVDGRGSHGDRSRGRVLRRPHHPRRRHDGHARVRRGDLRAGARRDPRGGPGGGDRPGQRQPVRQRDGDLHVLRRRGAHVPAGRERRHDRHQRADPRARSAGTRSAAGRTRCSARATSTARSRCGSTRAARWSPAAGRAARPRPSSTSAAPRPTDATSALDGPEPT